MVQHEAVIIRLGERGSLLADVARLFGGIRDCSGQNNLRVLLQRYWLTMHGAVGELSPPDRSCGAVEQAVDDDGLAPDIMTVNLSKLSLPHHRHRFETRQSSPRGMETAEAEPRPDKALDTPVVLLDDVVEVFALPQTGAAR